MPCQEKASDLAQIRPANILILVSQHVNKFASSIIHWKRCHRRRKCDTLTLPLPFVQSSGKRASGLSAHTLVPSHLGLIVIRPLQKEVIVAALDGNDVFLQAATSFGKSLCFQLPAVVDFGSMLPALISNHYRLRNPSHHCYIAVTRSDEQSNRCSANG